MPSQVAPEDRRRYPRVPTPCIAVVKTPDTETLSPYAVENLSAGGALLLDGPVLSDRQRIQLNLQGLAPHLLTVKAVVARAGSTEGGIPWAGVEFVDVDAAVGDVINGFVEHELTHPPVGVVLISDGDIRRLSQLSARLHNLGRRALMALTAPDALHLLRMSQQQCRLALVGATLRSGNGANLMALIALDFPRIHRVFLDETPNVATLERLLSLTDTETPTHDPWVASDVTKRLRKAAP
jgi:hypothetical protein